jgi:hypothetical protein
VISTRPSLSCLAWSRRGQPRRTCLTWRWETRRCRVIGTTTIDGRAICASRWPIAERSPPLILVGGLLFPFLIKRKMCLPLPFFKRKRCSPLLPLPHTAPLGGGYRDPTQPTGKLTGAHLVANRWKKWQRLLRVDGGSQQTGSWALNGLFCQRHGVGTRFFFWCFYRDEDAIDT